jgi:hypothetical protein
VKLEINETVLLKILRLLIEQKKKTNASRDVLKGWANVIEVLSKG